MKLKNLAHWILVLGLSGPLLASAADSSEPVLQPVTENGITYISGGNGLEERQALDEVSGEYNLKHPNNEPFKVIDRGLRDAIKRLGDDYAKLRPFLQDFNLGRKGDRQYGPQDVRAQIMAAKKNLLESWVLWNPGNKYNWAALTPQSYRAFVDPEYGAEPSPAKK